MRAENHLHPFVWASFLLNAQGLQRPVIVFQDVPPHLLPEASPLNVCVQNKGVTLCDSLSGESAQASIDQRSGDPAVSVRLADRKMAQDASPTFVPAKHGTNDLISFAGNETQAPVPSEKDRDPSSGIRFLQAQSLASLPEGIQLSVVTDLHLADSVFHLFLRTQKLTGGRAMRGDPVQRPVRHPLIQSNISPFGKEQIPETNLITYQGNHDVENRPKCVYHASPPEGAWKTSNAKKIRIQ